MSAEALSPAMRRWRIALVAIGIALLAIGAAVALAEIPPTRYLAIMLWLGGALVIHDGIAAMAVLAVSVGLRKTARRIPFAVVIITQGALAIGAIVTVVVAPAIIKQAVGTANPSILPLDYTGALLIFHLVLATAAGLLILAVLSVRALRRR